MGDGRQRAEGEQEKKGGEVFDNHRNLKMGLIVLCTIDIDIVCVEIISFSLDFNLFCVMLCAVAKHERGKRGGISNYVF